MTDSEELPDRRRHGYADLEKKLDEHARVLDERLAEFIRRALIAFAVIGVTSVGSLVGFGVLLVKQSNYSDQIQTERAQAILRACVEQNVRHDDTIAQLEKVADEAAKLQPERAVEIRQSTASSVKIIEALVPKKDCLKRVNESVEGG